MTAIPLRRILRAAMEETTDDTIRKMHKTAKLIDNRGVKITFVETAATDCDGLAQWDKEGNFRLTTKAGLDLPILEIPVDGDVSVGVERQFKAVGSMNVKIRVESMVRVAPKE